MESSVPLKNMAVSVVALRRKISWELGAKEYRKVTLQQTSQKGKTPEGSCPCSGQRQQGTEWKAGFYRVSWGGAGFWGGGLVGF